MNHPVARLLNLNFKSMDLPTDPGLQLNVHTATAGGPTADKLALLASWASRQTKPTTRVWDR